MKLYTTITALLLACSAWAADMYYDGLYFNIINENELELVHHGDVVDEYISDYYTYIIVENNYTNLNPRIVIPEQLNYYGTTYTVTCIGVSAFMGCEHLTHITMPKTITTIYNSAFDGCTSLEYINLPEGLTTIAERAFSGCKLLRDINIPTTVNEIAGYALDSTAWLANQPDGVVYINDILYSYKGQLPNSAFIKVKDGTRKIADQAFANCTQLYYIFIPGSVESIGRSAFNGCSSLAKLVLSPGLTHIYDGAFSDCSMLTSVVLPEGLVGIGNWVFTDCNALKSLTIPASVEYVSPDFMERSPSITVHYGGTKSQWSNLTYESPEDVSCTVLCSDGKY